MIYKILSEFRDSEVPAYRKVYLDSLKRLVGIGEDLNKIIPCKETEDSIEILRQLIENYKLYPLVEGLSVDEQSADEIKVNELLF